MGIFREDVVPIASTKKAPPDRDLTGCTEIISFPYTGVKGNLRHFAGFSLSEEAISGPDKLQKTVPPPRGTEKGAIRDPSPRRNVAGGSAVG